VAALQEEGAPSLATTPIVELGFVRVASSVPSFGLSVQEARSLLQRIKASKHARFEVLPDDVDISALPSWVRGPKQITDGHLLSLARRHRVELATLDRGIAGAFLIPAA
jgi:predicted nucleic acid-binding protein